MKPDPYYTIIGWDEDGSIVVCSQDVFTGGIAFTTAMTPAAARKLAERLVERCDNLEAHYADNLRLKVEQCRRAEEG